jgi:hypothetical protein
MIGKAALDALVARRNRNTDETPEEALSAILEVLGLVDSGKLVLDVVDEAGVHIGQRDKDGYHPNAHDPSRRGKA